MVVTKAHTKALELTLGILKPHILAVPHVYEEIKNRIIDEEFIIVQSKIANITQTEAYDFYKEHTGKFFFNRLVNFMCSGPCEFLVLAKVNAIEDWRKMLGPTKVFKAQFTHPDTIRGEFGLTDTRNAAHGSDSIDSASREIKVFFPNLATDQWLKENSL